jgi:hypothetical protein
MNIFSGITGLLKSLIRFMAPWATPVGVGVSELRRPAPNRPRRRLRRRTARGATGTRPHNRQYLRSTTRRRVRFAYARADKRASAAPRFAVIANNDRIENKLQEARRLSRIA